MTVGIERLAVYVPGEAIRIDELASATGADAAALAAHGVHAVAVPAPCEDEVTLAATAGARMLAAARLDPGVIGLLVVASATVPRSRAQHVHELLGLTPYCRLLDLAHGGFAALAAVTAASDWIHAGGGRRRHALVLVTHARRAAPGHAPHRRGAAAVALLVGYDPQALILTEDGVAVVGARRPGMPRYLASLQDAFLAVRSSERPPTEPGEAFTDRLARCLYQAATPRAAARAHRHALAADWDAAPARRPAAEARAAAMDAACAEQLGPAIDALAEVGDVGPVSLWLQLAAILERDGRRLGGRRIGGFGWGGGVGEYFTGLVPAAVGNVADCGLATDLARRRFLDAASWAARPTSPRAGDPPPGFAATFLRAGTRRNAPVYVRHTPAAI